MIGPLPVELMGRVPTDIYLPESKKRGLPVEHAHDLSFLEADKREIRAEKGVGQG